jgi:hypothetical protein
MIPPPFLAPEDPWYFLQRFGAPNVKWCEATLHGWITEPANTWSNFAFIIVALLIWRQSRKSHVPLLSFFAPAALIMGLFSGIYHASSTFFLQVFDFFGMFLVFFIPLFINFYRLKWLTVKQIKFIYPLTVCLATITVPFFAIIDFPIQGLIGLLVLGILGSEVIIKLSRSQKNISYRPYIISFTWVFFAALSSAADVTRFYCHPDNHWFQPHAFWHVLCSLMVYYCFQFYRQFDMIPSA